MRKFYKKDSENGKLAPSFWVFEIPAQGQAINLRLLMGGYFHRTIAQVSWL